MSRLCILLLAASCAFAQAPVDVVVPESRREAVHAALKLAGDNAGALEDALRRAPETERDAMAFLVAYLPQSDLASMTADDLLENVALAVQAREETAWAKEVPDDVWRAFVLPHRSAQEPFERWRKPFHEEIAPRVAKCASLREAALEVNRWCNEHSTFQQTTARDQGPLTTVRRGIGRCEEEMILCIAAARSVGIPARAVFTRYWPFMDNNHAWVEVYADGGWHYLGACEPAADLDQAWFSSAASRAGMVITMAYGVLDGPEVYRKGRSFSVLNTTRWYGETGRLRVRVEKGGKPIARKDAFACVFNFGGPRALTRMITGEDGWAEAELGTGDYVVMAGEGAAYTQAIATVACGKTTEAVLALDTPNLFGEPFWLRYPPRAPKPQWEAAPPMAGPESQIRDLRRRVAQLEGRAADPELVGLLETTGPWIAPFTKVLIDAGGNWKEIATAAKERSGKTQQDLLDLLQGLDTKDRVEVSSECLTEHVELALESRKAGWATDDELYRAYVLAARVGEEPMSPWRVRTCELLPRWTANSIEDMARKVNEWIATRCEIREADALGNSLTPADVLVTHGGTEKDLAVAAVGCLRALGIPARLAQSGTWAEFHDGKEWKPLYPKDPANLGNAKRDEAASAQYAERGTIAVTFLKHGQATTEVENGREFAVMAFKDGASDDVDVQERRAGDKVYLAIAPGHVVLFAGVRNGAGEPFARPFPVNVEAGKEVPLTVDLDLPADEATRQRKTERKMERAPALEGVDWKGSSLVFLYSPNEEPSNRMRPLVEAWAKGKATFLSQALPQGPPGVDSEHQHCVDWATAFQLPRKNEFTFTSLPATILIKDGEILLWDEGYNLAIADVLEEAWTHTR